MQRNNYRPGGLILAGFLLFVVGCQMGVGVTARIMRQSAINAQVGEWRVSKDGTTEFCWTNEPTLRSLRNDAVAAGVAVWDINRYGHPEFRWVSKFANKDVELP